jgi:hypothetical protein
VDLCFSAYTRHSFKIKTLVQLALARVLSAEDAALREAEHEAIESYEVYCNANFRGESVSEAFFVFEKKLNAVRALRPKAAPTPGEIAKSELESFDVTELFDDNKARRMYGLLANSDLVERDGRLVPRAYTNNPDYGRTVPADGSRGSKDNEF